MSRAWVACVAFLCGALLTFGFTRISDRLDDYVETRIPIKNTLWNAETRSGRRWMPLLYGGFTGIDIRLVNDTTGSQVQLVEGADVLDDNISSDAPNELTITLPNLTVARLHMVKVPGVNVVWNFTPTDDPEERQMHRAWALGGQAVEANRVWYCQHLMPKELSGPDLLNWDERMAVAAYGSDASEKHYCLR